MGEYVAEVNKLILNLVYLLLISTALFLHSRVEPLDWDIIIADEDEPGQRLIVSGTVYDRDGKTPLPGITLYVYHTDSKGIYEKGEDLLSGKMLTNSNGKYRFRTIKPGSYPEGRNPAHIHIKITGNDFEEQWLELRFEGDPFISETELNKELSKGKFSEIQKLIPDKQGVLSCVLDIKIDK